MRYLGIDDLSFNDANGNTVKIKDIRPIPTYETLATVKGGQGVAFDELISRREFYGDGNEDLSYAVLDHNIIKMVEANFDPEKLKEIKIPLIEEVI